MKSIFLVACLVAFSSPASAATAEAAWKADLAETNKGYTVVPHAILKIQDAAYLDEGSSASLVGTRGIPGSYKWVNGNQANAVLTAEFVGGKAVIKLADKPVANPLAAVPVDKDVDMQAYPTQVQAGVPGIRVFVYNQQHPAAKAFKGVDYFPYDPSFVVKASFVADSRISAHVFMTSRGTSKQFYRTGEASFLLHGRNFVLPFYSDTNDPKKISSLSAFFTDELTGKGAYGAGRYVDESDFHGFPPKTFVIDFNYAYNPNCARSAFFTCPVAFDHLALAVTAGERDPHAQH
ncbi:MAG: DUF1684 domain-containing protein [Rhizomicrobium sp.]|jgi:uncharacterized protein (DUF1684 family)